MSKVSKTEFQLHILRGLLNYHKRMMLTIRECDAEKCENAAKCEGLCSHTILTDTYAETLEEAIRCIEIVHKDELKEAM